MYINDNIFPHAKVLCVPQPLDRDTEYSQKPSSSHQLSPEAKREEEVEDTENSCRTGSSSGSMVQMEEAEYNSKQPKSKFTSLPHITDLSTHMIQKCISFAKLIQAFR